jgi:hypothetical protein
MEREETVNDGLELLHDVQLGLGKMVSQRGLAANKPWRAGLSPREALASLPNSGAEAPRGLKSTLRNRRGTQRFPCLVVQAKAFVVG